MADYELSSEELSAIELVAQLAALSPEGDLTSVRITVRTGTGRLVGEALLSAKAVETLTDTVVSVNAFHDQDDPDDPEIAAEAARLDAEAAHGADQVEQWLRTETEGGA